MMFTRILFSAESPSAQFTVPEADSTSSPIVAVSAFNKYETETAPFEPPCRASAISRVPWFSATVVAVDVKPNEPVSVRPSMLMVK